MSRVDLTRIGSQAAAMVIGMHDVMPLGCLAAGTTGEIATVTGRAEEVHRLREMGLRDGVRIEVLHRGSPCILRVNGNRLCFRDCETMGVLVRVATITHAEPLPAISAPAPVASAGY
jgi:Fe2+ transport system protein FeoA